MTTFTVTAERGTDPKVWVLQCAEWPGAISQTRRLSEAPRLMRETIAWVSGVDEADVQIQLRPVLPEGLFAEVEAARQAVAALAEQQRQTAALSRAAAAHLIEAGLSGADTANVLGVSPQRVSQLVGS